MATSVNNKILTIFYRCFLALAVAATGLPAAATPPPPTGLEVLDRTRWGMDATELETALHGTVVRLPGRWDFGPLLYADLTIPAVTVAGYAFRAFLQMDRHDGRLLQIMLERRGNAATPMVFEKIVAALTSAFGKPDGPPRYDPRLPVAVDMTFHRNDDAVTASFFDQYTNGIFSQDPNIPLSLNPLIPYYLRERNNPSFLPRRAIVRIHPAARTDLDLRPAQ
jgi:hypothetical protein